jgi:lipoprotein-releasing system ATP-binding protein
VQTVLRAVDVSKSFEAETQRVDVLRGISFEIEAGRALAVTGPSGSGKSTLLHLIGGLDRPSSGSIEIGGQDPYALSEPELARFRNRTVGFVFQEHHLLPQYSVLENVLLPTLAFPGERQGSTTRARELLERVGFPV